MPYFDGRGPWGMGPGKGRGFCRMMYGCFRFGCNFLRGSNDRITLLKEYKQELEQELGAVEKELQEHQKDLNRDPSS